MQKQLAIILLVSSFLLAEDTFTLGEISITDQQEGVLDVTKISNQELTNLPQKDIAKVLDTQAGITLEPKGGRAESSIMIRGLEASRIGVFMDGIPLSVPYDGNFDYSRVLSTDLDSVSIAEGFSSALFGANTMGGVINFVTKKPTKAFEGSFSSQLNTDSGFTSSQTINTLSLGTKQDKYYLQFSGTIQDRSHWNLSDDFTPTSNQESGERSNSGSEHKSFNLKAGYTPNDTVEYVLGASYLHSTKSQPVSVDDKDSNYKYIKWPRWDSNSVYFIANKKYDTSDLKFKLYRTGYKNTYTEYKKSNYTNLKEEEQTDAYSIGSNLEYAEYGWSDQHIVKFRASYQRDYHEIVRLIQENDKFIDQVYSLSAEDIYQVSDRFKVISSLDYDYSNPTEAVSYDKDMELKTNHAWNPQIGFFYNFEPNQTTRFTIARKTHLPTMKERFSDKRGKAIPNPDLVPEKATHFELGHNIKMQNFTLDAALFYIDVKDAINIVENVSGSKSQEQNTGNETFKGFQTTLKYQKNQFATGINYTYTSTDKDDDSLVLNVPKNQVYFYASYSPLHSITLRGNISYKNDVILEKVNGDYEHMPSITVIGASIDYNVSKALLLTFGVENLTDENYELDLGYPSYGREYYAKFTYTF